MGLAPYGNPETYRNVFKGFYQLLPNGRFKINTEYFVLLNNLEGIPREKDEPFTQVHKDLAAALQESLEIMVLMVISNTLNVLFGSKSLKKMIKIFTCFMILP